MDWLDDIEDVTGHRPDYPIIADTDLAVAKLYDMLPAAAGDSAGTVRQTMPQSVQFSYWPDRRIKLSLTYPMSTGRNFSELLRVIDLLQRQFGTRWLRLPTGKLVKM